MALLTELSAVELLAGIESGDFTVRDVVKACIDRIAERDNGIKAWEYFQPDLVDEQLIKLEQQAHRGLLHGIPVGIKDNSNTIDMPTGYGSPIYKDYLSGNDAAYVVRLRQIGAVILGKTVTTEFAYFQPGLTANPVNLQHTPGVSSSGSAAAVADHLVPIAFGTQVAGSLTRPASYCGILGYKASFGVFSSVGIKGFAHSLGTLGWMARTVDDLELVRSALLGSKFEVIHDKLPADPKIGLFKTFEWDQAQDETHAAIEHATQTWSANGARIEEVKLPDSFSTLVDAQKTVMAFEAVQGLGHENYYHTDKLSGSISTLLELGKQCSYDDYVEAQRLAEKCRGQLASIQSDYDALLTPSAPGEAPKGLDATGDPLFNRIWTLLHVPTVNIPGFYGPNGLPVGVQLVGAMYEDKKLFQVANWCHTRMG